MNGKWLVEYGVESENGGMAGKSRAFENYSNACVWAQGQTREGYIMYVWYPSDKLVDRNQWMTVVK